MMTTSVPDQLGGLRYWQGNRKNKG